MSESITKCAYQVINFGIVNHKIPAWENANIYLLNLATETYHA